MNDVNHDQDLNRFRAYLRCLAEVELGPELQRKIDPSDVVQDTFLQAYRSLGKFRGHTDGECAKWLRRILATRLDNTLRDLRRVKRDFRREYSLEQALDNSSERLAAVLHAAEPSPSKKAEHQEVFLQVADALASLPDDQRQVILLKHWCGHSLSEIESHTGRSRHAVVGLLRRGLKTLREKLKVQDDTCPQARPSPKALPGGKSA